MTPKEKATELFEKYKNPFDRKGCIPPTEIMFNSTAKQCALIAVDEILDLGLHDVGDYRNDQESLDDFSTVTWYINYWQEVKNELEYMYTKQLPK
jgi:hypothetical protein